MGSILACILPKFTVQKQLVQSSILGPTGSTGSACLFLPLDFAAAFGKWTFTACTSLPNAVHTCLICAQICVEADLHSGFTSFWVCSFAQISLYRPASLPDGSMVSHAETYRSVDSGRKNHQITLSDSILLCRNKKSAESPYVASKAVHSVLNGMNIDREKMDDCQKKTLKNRFPSTKKSS